MITLFSIEHVDTQIPRAERAVVAIRVGVCWGVVVEGQGVWECTRALKLLRFRYPLWDVQPSTLVSIYRKHARWSVLSKHMRKVGVQMSDWWAPCARESISSQYHKTSCKTPQTRETGSRITKYRSSVWTRQDVDSELQLSLILISLIFAEQKNDVT